MVEDFADIATPLKQFTEAALANVGEGHISAIIIIVIKMLRFIYQIKKNYSVKL